MGPRTTAGPPDLTGSTSAGPPDNGQGTAWEGGTLDCGATGPAFDDTGSPMHEQHLRQNAELSTLPDRPLMLILSLVGDLSALYRCRLLCRRLRLLAQSAPAATLSSGGGNNVRRRAVGLAGGTAAVLRGIFATAQAHGGHGAWPSAHAPIGAPPSRERMRLNCFSSACRCAATRAGPADRAAELSVARRRNARHCRIRTAVAAARPLVLLPAPRPIRAPALPGTDSSSAARMCAARVAL